MGMLELMKQLQREAREGGELTELPCPLCGRPRSQRSDYIRCQGCGMNWLPGEDVNRDARLSRAPYLGTRVSGTEPSGSA